MAGNDSKHESRDFTKEATSRTIASLASELMFVVLPFLVLALVALHRNTGIWAFLAAPEWSFAASVLFGQTVVKLVAGVAEADGEPIAENLGFTVALLIVLGLVPAMVLLTMVLLVEQVPIWLGVSQVGLFLLSSVAFMAVGGAAHSAACEARSKLKAIVRAGNRGAA